VKETKKRVELPGFRAEASLGHNPELYHRTTLVARSGQYNTGTVIPQYSDTCYCNIGGGGHCIVISSDCAPGAWPTCSLDDYCHCFCN
jgi:hypothetical protein